MFELGLSCVMLLQFMQVLAAVVSVLAGLLMKVSRRIVKIKIRIVLPPCFLVYGCRACASRRLVHLAIKVEISL